LGQLEEKAAELPTQSGVYLYKDRRGRVLYVGKANNLRSRVRQYIHGHDDRAMVPHLVRSAVDIEVIVTHTEQEALLLENTLIKKHRPRFNAKLRDDANYLHLRINPREPWPRFTVTRNLSRDGSRTFGPYASATRARATLTFIQRAFPLRTCSDSTLKNRTRPCLLYQMKRCLAPCVDLADKAEYDEAVKDAMMLLDGRSQKVVKKLEARMARAAEDLRFEDAARLRDLIKAIQATIERQHVIDPRMEDRDVWGLVRDGGRVAIAILPIRRGVLGEPQVIVREGAFEEDEALLSSTINTHYDGQFPAEILVPLEPESGDALRQVLSDRLGRKVTIHVPQRGKKARLLELAAQNARVRFDRAHDEASRRADGLASLAQLLDLDGPPQRMECFDNSHLSGTDPVAAMAVFMDGAPSKKDYRRYRIKTAKGGDDYGGMREILTRRFKRALDDGIFPDLLVVDGGKGQLGVALAVLQDLGIEDQPVIGLAKPRTERKKGQRAVDKIVLPNVREPVRLRSNNPALQILQHLRDETHNAAVRYQGKVRRKQKLTSVLEGVPGVGPSRRRALLKALGSMRAVASASVEEIAAVPGMGEKTAQTIWNALHPNG